MPGTAARTSAPPGWRWARADLPSQNLTAVTADPAIGPETLGVLVPWDCSRAIPPYVVLVGREREMAAVRLLLRRAAAGTGGVLVVHGPPGAGRTTLADAAAAEGRQQGFPVLRVAAAPGGPARMVWAQLVREAGGPLEVARLLLEGEAGPLDLDRAAEVLASAVPRLIVVDDLDRAGPAAAAVLPVLGARVAGSATAVVGPRRRPWARGRRCAWGR